jgi:Fungal specific transcription factor domain
LTSVQVQRVDSHGTYAQVSTAMDHVPLNFCISSAESEQYFRLDRETLGLYFTHVNSVLPFLKEADTWHLFNTGTLDPSLLISINLISQRWKESKVEGPTRPATNAIEEVAMRQFNCSLAQPLLSTIQAGLLLIQFSTRTPYLMSTQLTAIGYELGLHQDCSQWKISQPEKNLRKRLGWMLYAQDKWFSLLHGRPSYVSPANWTIPPLSEQDFEDGSDVSIQSPAHGAASVSSAVFMMQFTTLTQILSEILETFHTPGAQADVQAAGSQGLRVVLERAKPVQIKLKNWFSRLPDSLKMDASGNDTVFVNGSLHLAYFATEITLHRCIIRATAQPDTDSYLSYICRSAAKTRLISAMDLINRLRPVHLQSFWPFAGFSHFALVGTFGALLEATAATKEEAEFYHMRLEEYRWTLMVSRIHAEFLGFAIDSLDTNLELLHNLPEKPGSAELKPLHAMPDIVISGSTMLDPGQGQDSVDIQRDPAKRNFSGLVSPATSSTSSSSTTGGQGSYLESNRSG